MTNSFCFKSYEWNNSEGILHLYYSYKEYEFVEKIVFPNAPFELAQDRKNALNHLFFLLHIAAGVSYYKAFNNPDIEIKSGVLSEKEALFFNNTGLIIRLIVISGNFETALHSSIGRAVLTENKVIFCPAFNNL